MNQEPKQFSDKFNSLPEEVIFYFSSQLSGRLILELARQYSLNPDDVYNLVFDAVNYDFDFVYLANEIKKLGLPDIDQNNFSHDFIGKILLPIDAYLPNRNIKKELIKNGGEEKLYQPIVQEFFDLIEDENFKEVDNLIDLHEKVVDPKSEKNYALDLFANHLIEVISADSLEGTRTLNSGLIYLLNNDASFKVEAVRVLLANNQRLTSASLSLDGRDLAPTVSNWIRDFIKINGSELFDELTLVEYLGSATNAKKLSPTEKDLLRKILKLYRNLSFFPESLAKMRLSDWQIVPIVKDDKVISDFRDALDEDGLNHKPGSVEPLKNAEEAIAEKNTMEKAIAAKVEEKNRESEINFNNNPDPLAELEQALGMYTPSSLEHKAVTQEIEHLKRKKR